MNKAKISALVITGAAGLGLALSPEMAIMVGEWFISIGGALIEYAAEVPIE